MKMLTFISQVADRLHGDAYRAERITGVVLHELRDRLPAADAANVARCLPTALRPLWMANDPRPDTIEQTYRLEFLGAVMESGALPDSVEAERAVVAVLTVLQGFLDRVARDAHAASERLGRFPHDLAVLWRAAETCGRDAPQRRRSRTLAARSRSDAASRSSAA